LKDDLLKDFTLVVFFIGQCFVKGVSLEVFFHKVFVLMCFIDRPIISSLLEKSFGYLL
jgi:hypothetical protein